MMAMASYPPQPLGRLLGLRGEAGVDVCGLTADSRKVQAGYLFAALPGAKTDGRHFIPDALTRGAAAILLPESTDTVDLPDAVCAIADPAPRRLYARLCARFYTPQPQVMAAVTGTNGKTSVASFTRQIWTRMGRAGGSLGTLGVEGAAYRAPGGLTSPDPADLHCHLAALAEAGVTHAVCEASSHGLDQYRLDGAVWNAGAFTNLSRDHLDYHGSLEAYWYAKARLFAELLPRGAHAVIHTDDEAGRRMADLARGRGLDLVTVGGGTDAGLRLRAAEPDGDGQRLDIHWAGRDWTLRLPLPGRFQADNALVAAALAGVTCNDMAAALHALEGLSPVAGRLEKIGETPAGATLIVDYAHTPAGLETVLKALRPHCAGRLAVVFGCGGDRDRGKRPEMGRIAAARADLAIVTDDNPRSENPASIRAEILAACAGARDIADRTAAIRVAASELGAGDILVIAGKGHEDGQIRGSEVLPHSDIAVARSLISGGGDEHV